MAALLSALIEEPTGSESCACGTLWHYFHVCSHLQKSGLLNDSNICSLISVILCFHRIALKNHLIDPDNLALDLSSLVFLKVLSALPSQDSFSLQLFIDSWNESGKAPRIHPGYTDVAALAEGLLSNLQFKEYQSRPPVITQFLGTFHCLKCGKEHVRVKNWELQVQSVIPLLQLPSNDHPVNIYALFEDYLGETLNVIRLFMCIQERIMFVFKGHFP